MQPVLFFILIAVFSLSARIGNACAHTYRHIDATGYLHEASTGVDDIDPPRPVQFRLADGVHVRGTLTYIDQQGLDGSFGWRQWAELNVQDVWRLHLALMDHDSADDWIALGRVLALASARNPQWSQVRTQRCIRLADRAFDKATQIDERATTAIEQIRLEAQQAAKLAARIVASVESHKLRVVTPEAGPWPDEPWPEQSAEHIKGTVSSLRARGEKIVETAGEKINLLETAHFMIWMQSDPDDVVRWARRLEALHRTIVDVFGLPPTHALRSRKTVVLVWGEQDRFRLTEADEFGHLVAGQTIAMTHYDGPSAIVHVWRHRYDADFASGLLLGVARGLLHGLDRPTRPPAWINDGLAAWAIRQSADDAPGETMPLEETRRAGLEFLRVGGCVSAVLDRAYDEHWPGENGVGLGVACLAMELLMQERPARVADWFRSIKRGAAWDRAMRTQLGMSRGNFEEVLTAYYRVND